MKRYQLVFRGEIDGSLQVDTVKRNLSAALKKDMATIERLFTGRPVVLKKDLQYESAAAYQRAIAKNYGALCDLAEMPSGPKPPASKDGGTSPEKGAVDLERVLKKCVRCNEMVEALRHSCPTCGNDTAFSLDFDSSAEIMQRQSKAAECVDESVELIGQGRYAEAEALLTKAISLNPFNETAHGNMGGVFYCQGRYAEAIPWFEKALKINPGIEGIPAVLEESREKAGTGGKGKGTPTLEIRFSRASDAFFVSIDGEEEQYMTRGTILGDGLVASERELWRMAYANPASDEPPGGWSGRGVDETAPRTGGAPARSKARWLIPVIVVIVAVLSASAAYLYYGSRSIAPRTMAEILSSIGWARVREGSAIIESPNAPIRNGVIDIRSILTPKDIAALNRYGVTPGDFSDSVNAATKDEAYLDAITKVLSLKGIAAGAPGPSVAADRGGGITKFHGLTLTPAEAERLEPQERYFETRSFSMRSEKYESGDLIALWPDTDGPIHGGEKVTIHWLVPQSARRRFDDAAFVPIKNEPTATFQLHCYTDRGMTAALSHVRKGAFEADSGTFQVDTPPSFLLKGKGFAFLILYDGRTKRILNNVIRIPLDYR